MGGMKYKPNHINSAHLNHLRLPPPASPSSPPQVVLFSNQVYFSCEHDAFILNIPSVLPAVKAYDQTRAKRDPLAYPLASRLQVYNSESPAPIPALLQGHVGGLDQSLKSDERLTK